MVHFELGKKKYLFFLIKMMNIDINKFIWYKERWRDFTMLPSFRNLELFSLVRTRVWSVCLDSHRRKMDSLLGMMTCELLFSMFSVSLWMNPFSFSLDTANEPIKKKNQKIKTKQNKKVIRNTGGSPAPCSSALGRCWSVFLMWPTKRVWKSYICLFCFPIYLFIYLDEHF